MNQRERYLETLLFGAPDRIPLQPGGGRKSTREKWHQQGLPESVSPEEISEYAYGQIGGAYEYPRGGESFRVSERMIPEFEEKVIEVKENTQIVQDWKGNICEIGNEFTTDYLRNAIDFVTRKWIKCPVENRDDWESMKERYDPADPNRLPEDPGDVGRRLGDRTWPIVFSFSGPFWQMREWLGFENLCTCFYDDPDLIRDMVSFWTDYVASLMERAFAFVIPDEVHLSEDMAYKAFSMVSPDMAKQFLLPAWSAWGDVIRNNSVPVYGMDSDGFIGELIPIWIDAGINVCDPIEVAAHNDIVAFREEFGKNIAYRGGVDKRKMAAGGSELDAELQRIQPVIDSGGFIPSCDHGIPSDVSWPNFLHYLKGLAQMTGWM